MDLDVVDRFGHIDLIVTVKQPALLSLFYFQTRRRMLSYFCYDVH